MRLRSASRAIHDAYAIQLAGGKWDLMPRAPRRDSSNRVCSLIEAGYIISAVEKTPHGAWGRFAYGPTETASDIEQICAKIWIQFQDHCGNLSVSRQVKLMALPMLCAQNTRIASWGGEHQLSIADICRIVGIDASHWSRDFAHHWDRMRSILEDWDAELLTAVAEQVRCLNGVSRDV